MTIKEFIEREDWKFAKTYAAFAPHEYILRGRCVATNEEYDNFIRTIQTHGIRMFYYKSERKYLYYNGYFYWALWSKNDFSDAIINRCRPDDYDVIFIRRNTNPWVKDEDRYKQYELPLDEMM